MADSLSIVRNRTTTQSHDALRAQARADADRRRAELDKKRALTKKDPGAKLHNHALGGTQTHPCVVLKLVHKDGTTIDYETCEFSVDVDGFTLIIACPFCIFRYDRTQDDSQITLRSWHRKFELVERGRGTHWVNPKPLPGTVAEVVMLVGAIQTIDVQTCPVCNCKFHLEPDRHEAGVTVLREA